MTAVLSSILRRAGAMLTACILASAPLAAAPAAVGRVIVEGAEARNVCTGTLVAPDRVLTAAHCLLAPDGARRALDRVLFLPGSAEAPHAAPVDVASWRVHPRAANGSGIEARHDIAILRLAARVEAAPLAFSPRRDPAPVTLSGYARADIGPTELTGCARIEAARYTLDCRISDGISGGPVLTEETPPRIAGVLSGTTSRGTVAARIDAWTRRAARARPYTR